MNILLLDTETTGMNPEVDRCIEVACCLYDTTTASPIVSYSSLIKHDANPAEPINRISVKSLLNAPDEWEVWPKVLNLAEKAECLVAHRASFDRLFVNEMLRDRIWICSKSDILWPDLRGGTMAGDHLVHLSLFYGLGVVSAHRALTDVDIMVRIFTRVAELGFDLDKMLTSAMRPKERFVALVPYEKKDTAKKLGFLWDADRREWYRHMPPEDTPKLPFQVRRG